MNMKLYWAKIAGGAALIFVVGFGILSAAKATKREVVRTANSDSDITIPVPFLPFNFNGTDLGNLRKLVIHRSGPEKVSAVDVTVRLDDLAALDGFKNCHLTVDDPTRVNQQTSFRCVTLDSTMETFGQVHVNIKDADGDWVEAAVVPLALPIAVAKGIRGEAARAHVSQLEADRFREIGDSMRTLGQALGQAASDSLRNALEEQMQALQDEMEQLQENIADAARSRAEESAARVKVDPPAPARAPKPPN